MSGRNGYFQLVIRQNGTYLKIFKAQEGGQPVKFEEVCSYFADIKVLDYDQNAIGRALATQDTSEVMITNAIIPPCSESLKVTISEDRMMVTGRLYPPSEPGNLLNRNEIISTLVSKGVKYGVDEIVIENFMKDRRYCTDYVLAKATPPVQGHDAVITYLFNLDRTLKPKLNDDGSVDFHQLDMISHCNKDQLLATLTPMELGKPGIDVCGCLLRPNKVNNAVLRYGNNIYLSEDGLSMYSGVNGHVTLTDGRVFVSDTYEIPSDVDASTGDINYEGNVVIKGNVITGYTVRAKGDIEVDGVVEGAFLEAGGQIVLKRGMQGMNKGILKANGNIISKFIESAEVKAGGYITTESILHSKVSAKGDITVGGKRGFVTGGEIRSGTFISVKTAGSPMGTPTLLEVGTDPSILEEFRALEKKIIAMMADKEKISQALAVFRKKLGMGTQITEEKMGYLKQITQSNILLETQIKEARERYEILRIEMDNITESSIKAQGSVYPGTKIVISNIVYFVRTEIQFSKFIRDRADIKVVPI